MYTPCVYFKDVRPHSLFLLNNKLVAYKLPQANLCEVVIGTDDDGEYIWEEREAHSYSVCRPIVI